MHYRNFFRKLDTDNNGSLNLREVRDFLALLGHTVEVAVIREFIRFQTGGMSDQIEEETFVKFIKKEVIK
ncbi:unnamed protein product [Protopolystoma xenopodis]|uniref:EF-hand domain-containing protein n=1 Tax=Protopolystoma xenopodis TaxID=117903 RepID=A0A448WD04_9PLAT|nr:unnamed protein product [Protopolystoma xenopodis]